MGGPIGGPLGGVAGGYVAGKLASSQLEEETGAGIWGNLFGSGRYGRMKTPVDLLPLVKNGIPWTAGLKGFGEGNWKLRMEKRWANIKRGWEIAKRALVKAISGGPG